MSAAFLRTQVPGWYRFMLGDFECTVVSDGEISTGPVGPLFPEADQDEVIAMRRQVFMPADAHQNLPQNALIVNTGRHVVMFDCGMGPSMMLGPDAGQLLTNMRHAGIVPAQIDMVLLSHPHPDHCGGLSDAEGNPVFPNAQVALSEVDFRFWTDADNLDAPEPTGSGVAVARKSLLPYWDRLFMVRDGGEVVPGVISVATPGHTEGHYMYVIESRGESLVFFGDLCHDHVVELARPEWKVGFDDDPELAIRTRRRVYEQVAQERHQLLAYHFPWPGHGHLISDKTGYRYLPIAMKVGGGTVAGGTAGSDPGPTDA